MEQKSGKEVPEAVFENGVWKGTKINFPEGYHRIGKRILEQFRKYPDFIGQIDGASGKKDSYQMMSDRSIRCALWLKKQGIKPGDVIGFCSKNHLDSCIPFFASFFIDTIFNPWWDSSLDEELVIYFLKTTNPKVLFIDEESAELIMKTLEKNNYALPVVVFGQKTGLLSFEDILEAQNDGQVKTFECTDTKAEEPAIIMYTSGTTSNPKGALHSNRSLAHIMSHYPTDNTSQIILGFSTLCWISGIMVTLRSIFYKYTMINSHHTSEEVACRFIEKYKVTRIIMGTSFANRFSKRLNVWNYDLSSLSLLMVGGGVLSKEITKFLHKLFKNADIHVVYGTTEFGITVVTGPNSPKVIAPKGLVSCGRALANVEIKIVDPETNKILGPNEEGELYCRAPTLLTCYWNNPSATEEVFDSDDWFRSGDLAYYDEDGDIFIVERMKEMIKYRLHHVAPAAIENVIQELPGVAEVAVVAKPNLEDLEQPMAFVTRVPGMEITEDEIHEAVGKKLHDKTKLRGGICFLDKMPYTASKKIAKKELRRMARALVEKS
ncbi:luciferin 4-monooxygenase-like [Cotesia glomerata]|uniref:Luciferin 4-monooxygenase-like n=1 Tax=Cotesia glomerata TaxID=32391 RepID=A0AAV7IWU5_COTGL|nr:luciferin 4-monooxygenase-like [Cotesia glomerata]KAH0561667.1 hypothetical protein KQX54_018583 [Cotesia glomerata]